MDVLEISLEQAFPVSMQAYEVDLNQSPPTIKDKSIDISKYVPANKLVKVLQFRDASFDEGILNVYSCLYDNEECTIFLFGNFQNTEIKTEASFKNYNQRNFDMLNERIKFILSKSRNILKSYYKDNKIKNIEHHIMVFLKDD